MTKIELDEREVATVVAALYYWRREGLMSSGHEQALASCGETITQLGAGEIDELAQRINDAETPEECQHDFNYTGVQYGGEDESYHGEGRVYCTKCGADGDG